jgi:hypothetical protein
MGSVWVKIDPCSIENSWSICSNRGSGTRRVKTGSGRFSLFHEMIYSEPHMGSDCHFLDQVFGFFGNGVHRYNKYCLKWLFIQNNRFERDLSLQFIGVLAVTIFNIYFRWLFGRNGLQMPLVARHRFNVGELGVLKGFVGLFSGWG